MKRFLPLLLLFALSGCDNESPINVAATAFQAVQKNNLADFRRTLTVDAQERLGTQEMLNRLAAITSKIDVSHEEDLDRLLSTTPHGGCFWHSDCANSATEEHDLPLVQLGNSSKTLGTIRIQCKTEFDLGNSKHPASVTLRECRIEDIEL